MQKLDLLMEWRMMGDSKKGASGTWIKFYRDIQTHWLWEDKPFAKGQAWIDLVALAKFQNEKFLDSRGNLIDGKRGVVYRSINSLSMRWGWSRHKTENFLQKLEQEEMIVVDKKRASQRTTIFIVNYGKYQSLPTSKRASQGQAEDKRQDKPGTSRGQAEDIYKNDKECIKNDKEIKESVTPDTETENLIVKAWNNAGGVPVRGINPGTKRESAFMCLVSDFTEREILAAIDNIKASEYLTGQNDNGWKIDFDWFLNPDNFMKVYEGRYGKANNQRRAEPEEKSEWERI